MATHACCPRCGMKHRGSLDLCTRCHIEVSMSYTMSPDAMPQLFAVVRAARAVAAAAPASARKLVRALAAMDRAWRKE